MINGSFAERASTGAALSASAADNIPHASRRSNPMHRTIGATG
jgi:hypothetical protein